MMSVRQAAWAGLGIFMVLGCTASLYLDREHSLGFSIHFSGTNNNSHSSNLDEPWTLERVHNPLSHHTTSSSTSPPTQSTSDNYFNGDHDDPDDDENDTIDLTLDASDPPSNDIVHATFKEPSTPPDSLPSDPFAQYTYQIKLPLSDNFLNPRAKRTIVVGDVHGSLQGLDGFLLQIGFNPQKDNLILAGDLVAKGPQSLEVIDRAMELRAKCVRGNHDDKVIRWKGFLESLTLMEQMELDKSNPDEDHAEDDVDDEGGDGDDQGQQQQPQHDSNNDWTTQRSHRRRRRVPKDLDRKSDHYEIAKGLNPAQYQYLLSCPLILTLPRELSVHSIPIHVVHAGIDPRRGILRQKPWVLFNVRNLLKDGTPSRKKKKGQGWAKAFNDLHTRRSPTKRDFLVVYGHDAGRSLNVMTWSIGLDSGCVYGRQLSGYVVETGEIYQVPCPKPRRHLD